LRRQRFYSRIERLTVGDGCDVLSATKQVFDSAYPFFMLELGENKSQGDTAQSQ
jgi:hypothetical protein